MKTGLLILILLIASLLLLAIIGLGALWLGGSKIIVLPGLGIMIATPFIVGLLIVVEVVVLISASLLWRLSS
jgi:hypothetical protein